MNDRQRLAALTAAQRLTTAMQSLKLSPAEFVKKRRAIVDEVLQLVAQLVAPPRRQKIRWRRWSELPPIKQASILDFLARRACDHDDLRLELAKHQILWSDEDRPHVPYYHPPDRKRYGVHGGFRVYDWGYSDKRCPPKRMLPTDTPIARLEAARLRAVSRIYLGPGHTAGLIPTFLPNLHPDDVECDLIDGNLHATLDRAFRKLTLKAKWRDSDNIWREALEVPFARSLAPTDPLTGCEVFYCALLEHHRSAPSTLCRVYIGRAWDISTKTHRITSRFKHASNALAAALKLYGDGAARVVHQEPIS
jgi:hypothetical protein